MNFYDLEPGRQQALSLQRLFRYVRRDVGRYHPHLRRAYRERGVRLERLRTAQDLLSLPFVHKADLRANPSHFVLQPRVPGGPPLPDGFQTDPLTRLEIAKLAVRAAFDIPRDPSRWVREATFRQRVQRRGQLEWLPIHYHVTTGSTGEPTPVVFTRHDLQQVVGEMATLIITQKRPRPGYLPFEWTERWMSLMPAAPHVAFYSTLISKLFAGSPGFETFGGAVIPTDRQIELFVKGGFAALLAIPSYVTYWLRRALALQHEQRVGRLTGLRRLVLGAEPLSETLREAIRRLALETGADPVLRIIESYGMTEFKWVFTECDEGTGIHLNPKYYYWELVDPETHQPVGPGAPGALVFSHIGWRGTVLIRYWTGDLVKGGMRWDRCEHCGYTFPRIFPPICRLDKDFTKIKGTLVDLSLLVEAVRDTRGVRRFQIALHHEIAGDPMSRDVVTIHVLCEPAAARQDVERAVRERVKAATEISADRIVFEEHEAEFEKRLFASNGVKADYLVEHRHTMLHAAR